RSLERTVFDAGDAFRKVLPDVLEPRWVAIPNRHDVRFGAYQMQFDQLSGGIGEPGYSPQTVAANNHSADLAKAQRPGGVGVFEAQVPNQINPFVLFARKNIDPAELRSNGSRADACIPRPDAGGVHHK